MHAPGGTGILDRIDIMTTYTVLLENETTAILDGSTLFGGTVEDFVGEIVDAIAKDENGNPVRVRGRLVEVLETREY